MVNLGGGLHCPSAYRGVFFLRKLETLFYCMIRSIFCHIKQYMRDSRLCCTVRQMDRLSDSKCYALLPVCCVANNNNNNNNNILVTCCKHMYTAPCTRLQRYCIVHCHDSMSVPVRNCYSALSSVGVYLLASCLIYAWALPAHPCNV